MLEMKERTSGHQSEWVRPLGRIQRPDQIAFKTRWRGPLMDATQRQRGLLFCELCEVAYLYRSAEPFSVSICGLENTSVHLHAGYGSARFENDTDVVLVFAAPEPKDWIQFVAEQKLRWAETEGLGRILHGLKTPADVLWQVWESSLADESSRRVWFTGHSLGGALSVVVANRCLISPIHVEPSEVHTFGMPRVGDRKYRDHSRVAHMRWVRDHDPVPQVPPAWSGFWHIGRETRLNLAGRELVLSRWERAMVFWEEIWRTVRAKKSRLWPLEEHSISTYVDTLWEANLREEEAGKK